MSRDKLTSNSYVVIEKKLEKLLTNVAWNLDDTMAQLVLKGFEKNLREPADQIIKYLKSSSK